MLLVGVLPPVMVSDRSPNLGVLENTTGDRPKISFSLVKLGDFGVPHIGQNVHFPGMTRTSVIARL